MAPPVTARFGKMLIKLGDGATPTEVFAAPCGLTSKSITFSKNLSEVDLPDCNDPDAATWLGRDVQNLSASVSGDGVLPADAVETWWNAFKAVESINVEISIEYSTGTMLWEGAVHLESFEPSAEKGGRVQASISMQSDGALTGTWTAAT
ncbi:phage tail tube protein [Martelella sp. FLE1502]|uniref:phage tail tube protein n=1 Tax=unclassified Martelella TaxID=2629616 RepID=UPI000C6A6639|nr:phage tail tube protein [Martelella sp.]MAU22544.1 hypothetical protein [Martelella sp.]